MEEYYEKYKCYFHIINRTKNRRIIKKMRNKIIELDIELMKNQKEVDNVAK